MAVVVVVAVAVVVAVVCSESSRAAGDCPPLGAQQFGS